MQLKINLTISAIMALLLGLMIYSATAAGRPQPGTGGDIYAKKWVLTAIAREDIAIKGETPFIVFDKEKGSAGGNTGCNVFGSTARIESKKLSITEVVSTMRACIEDERMDIERQFLDALQKADRFAIDDNILTIFRGETELLRFHGEAKTTT